MLSRRNGFPGLIFLCAFSLLAGSGDARCILAIGAHAGDMELSCGGVLAKHRGLGDRVVILHLSLGEAGHPTLSPDDYGKQKKREALAAAGALGAEVLFGPYADGLVPDTEEARRYVADVTRAVKPSCIITHWRNSMHKDHDVTHRVVRDAVLLAALRTVVSRHPPHRGVALYFAENWEDKPEFQPYLCIGVDEKAAAWKEAASTYEFARGGISGFPYVDYYAALMKVRGAEAGRVSAVCFDISAEAKRRVADALP